MGNAQVSKRDIAEAAIADALEKGYPILWCRKDGKGRVLGLCPNCDRTHTHGYAMDSGPVWGHRVAHCHGNERHGRGYVLIDAAYRRPRGA